jgi:glycosyltransferase involved in cell wall biosynthesis
MKISIITVVYNRKDTIRDTIESVLSQKKVHLEYIIKDGGSTDGTQEIVAEYLSSGKIKYFSEEDNSVYDAFNQGVLKCTGDVIGFLHSDDVFVDDNVLKDIVDSFDEIDIVYGNTIFVDSSKRIVRKWRGGTGNIKLGWAPPHTAIFVRASIYKRFGLFNTIYKIAADYDMLIRIFSDCKTSSKYLDRDIVYMRIGGISTAGFRSNIVSYKEINQIYRNNGIKFPLIVQVIRLFRRILQVKIRR